MLLLWRLRLRALRLRLLRLGLRLTRVLAALPVLLKTAFHLLAAAFLGGAAFSLLTLPACFLRRLAAALGLALRPDAFGLLGSAVGRLLLIVADLAAQALGLEKNRLHVLHALLLALQRALGQELRQRLGVERHLNLPEGSFDAEADCRLGPRNPLQTGMIRDAARGGHGPLPQIGGTVDAYTGALAFQVKLGEARHAVGNGKGNGHRPSPEYAVSHDVGGEGRHLPGIDLRAKLICPSQEIREG